MRAWTLVVALMAGAVAPAVAQKLPDPQTLMEAQRDIEYAELLNAARLTPDQLGVLVDAQTALQAASVLGPDAAAAFAEIRRGVLAGQAREQATNALAERQQAVAQAQMGLEQAVQTWSGKLVGALTEDQKSALAWFGTPARALDNMLAGAGTARAMPDDQWQQFRTQMSGAMAHMGAAMDPTSKVTPEQIGALLDAIHRMDSQTFITRRAALPREWAQVVMPGVLARLSDPQFRQQQVGMIVRQLLTYERGPLLVQAAREAPAAP